MSQGCDIFKCMSKNKLRIWNLGNWHKIKDSKQWHRYKGLCWNCYKENFNL